jgi:tetratricopeptide (TPR) repeat protein
MRSTILGWCHLHLGHLYGSVGSYADQVKQYFICKNYWHDSVSLTYIFMNLGSGYLNMNKLDSAIYYETKAYQMADPGKFHYYFKLLKLLGIINTHLGNYAEAKKYFYCDLEIDHTSNKNDIYSSLGYLYLRAGAKDSGPYFARLVINLQQLKIPQDISGKMAILTQSMILPYTR